MKNSIHFIQPANLLSNYIDNYYLVEFTATSDSAHIEQKPVSNGCVEMFIGYRDTIGTCYTNDGEIVRLRSALVGAHDLKNQVKAMALEEDSKTFKFVSINFKPDGFYDIFKIPPAVLYNSFFDISSVLGNEIPHLKDQLDHAQDDADMKRYLDIFFTNQLRKNSFKQYNVKAGLTIAQFIRQKKGIVRNSQLINDFSITERTLQRYFKIYLGLSPKEYCKIIRFNNLLDHVSFRKKINWFDMASQYGYYDQAHLINEFKYATSITPDIFMKYRNKNVFKINNHLVLMNSASFVNSEICEAIIYGDAGFIEYSNTRFLE